MRKLLAAVLVLSSLALAACAPENADASQPSQPTEPKYAYLNDIITVTNPDGTVERVERAYDGTRLTEETHYENDRLTVRYTATCDDSGRLMKLVDEAYGTGLSIEYSYTADGSPAKIETRLNGETYFIQTYAYNADGTLFTYTEEDLRSTTTVFYKYLYEEGVMRWEEYYENGELLYSWEYIYSGQQRSSGIRRDPDFVQTATREYSYAQGRETVTTYDLQGKLLSVKVTERDADGNVEKEIFTADGETTITQYTYQAVKIS